MIRIYFLDTSGSKEVINERTTVEDCLSTINNYICNNKLINKPYRRFWTTDDVCIMVDYGSHDCFFMLEPTCKRSEEVIKEWLVGD